MKYQEKIDIMVGGAYQAFPDTGKFFVLAFVGDNPASPYGTLKRITDRYNQAFNQPQKHTPHFTLLELDVNKASKFHDFLIKLITNKNMITAIAQDYAKNMTKVQLHSTRGNYTSMGNFVAKLYSPTPNTITDFRREFYAIIGEAYNKQFGTNIELEPGTQPVTDKKTGQTIKYKYAIDSRTKERLYAVPEWYFGANIWVPHLSIANMTVVNMQPDDIQAAYEKTARPPDPARNVPGNAISTIDMGTDIKSIRLSYSYKFGTPPVEGAFIFY